MRACSFVVLLAAVTAIAAPASAQTGIGAHVIVDNWNVGGVVTIPPPASHNSAGGSPTYQRLGVGFYRTVFPNQAGNAASRPVQHVEARGITNSRCHVNGRAPAADGTSWIVDVRCSSPAGVAVDSPFAVAITRWTGTSAAARAGYAATTVATPAAGWTAVPADFRYNSSGGGVFYERSSVGRYTVRFDNLAALACTATAHNPVPLVVAHAQDHTTSCSSYSYSDTTSNPTYVSVRCRNAAGAAVDSRFSVVLSTALYDLAVTPAWIGSNSAGADLACSSQNPGWTSFSTVHEGTGDYQTTTQAFMVVDAGNPIYTPLAFTSTNYASGDYCKNVATAVSGSYWCSSAWDYGYETTSFDVRCFDAAGNPKNVSRNIVGYGFPTIFCME